MATGINKVILIGNLGRDPEIRYTQSGTAVANFTLATTERWTSREGESQERTEWHRIVAWGKLAEICGEYLKKGKQVYIEGTLQYRDYEDRDGNTRYVTEIKALNMQMLGRRGDEEAMADSMPGGGDSDAAVTDDDIPF